MSDSLPISELRPKGEPRLDQWHRYTIVPPDQKKPTGYTRATTVAKALDSEGGLAAWQSTMCSAGIIMRRGLRTQWEALLAESGGDPWYATGESKTAAKALVEECAKIGGADDRRQIGDSLHALTAVLDSGRRLEHLTRETELDIAAYTRGLQAASISVLPDAIELLTVIDSLQIAGTLDRLVIAPGFDLPVVGDLKTGSNLNFQTIAVQLACYSRGEALYQQGKARDGSADTRLPMPAVDQGWGMIFHLPAGAGRLDIYLVDLHAGWEAVQHSLWARQWCQHSTPQVPFTGARPVATGESLEQQLQMSLEAIEARKQPEPPSGPLEPIDLRMWLQGRIDTIGQHKAARADLMASWPRDVPALRSSPGPVADALRRIEQVLTEVEKRHAITFPPPRPGAAVGKVLDMFPGATITNNHEKGETSA